MPIAASANAQYNSIQQSKQNSIPSKISEASNRSKSVQIDPDLAEKQSIIAKPAVKSRPSIASLVNENKGHLGKKVDITI